MGGVLGQAESPGGRLKVLMYWSAPLSAAQSQWNPFEQEFYGLLQLKRAIVKHFGRMPTVIHTDHAKLTRFEYRNSQPMLFFRAFESFLKQHRKL